MTTDVTIEKRNAAGIITLDRPRALNALTDEMRREIAAALVDFANDPIIYSMVIRSAGDRAFCAGGDVRELVEMARDDVDAAHASFGREYRLDWMLECFPKPTVSLIDGFVAGSGVGLTIFGTHKIAGPNYAFSMPEAAIGLFPDVGVCHPLSRLPDEIGTYLALTGARVHRADAFALGLVTHAASPDAFDDILAGLVEAKPVDRLLDTFAQSLTNEPTPIIDHRSDIATWFASDNLDRIFERLAGAAETNAFASETLKTLGAQSPLSLAVTLRHIRQTEARDIRETLIADHRLARRFLEGHDFTEGVRAMLVDKDRAPKWQPVDRADLTADMVDRYVAPLPEPHELVLPSREEMQRLNKNIS